VGGGDILPKKVMYEERDGVIGKMCTKCNLWKPLSEYPRCTSGDEKRRPRCCACESARRKDYYSKNKEREKEVTKIWVEKNKERYVQNYTRYKKENRDLLIKKLKTWHQNNKEKQKSYKKKYIRENLDAYLLRNKKRRALKAKLPNDLTDIQQKEILDMFDGGCALTGDPDINWDHVLPIAIGHGGTTYGNMIPLRKDLNFSKHTANIFDWFDANRQRFELSQGKFDKLVDFLSSANAMTVEEYREYVYWCHDNPRK
jgi:hypothetical protein